MILSELGIIVEKGFDKWKVEREKLIAKLNDPKARSAGIERANKYYADIGEIIREDLPAISEETFIYDSNIRALDLAWFESLVVEGDIQWRLKNADVEAFAARKTQTPEFTKEFETKVRSLYEKILKRPVGEIWSPSESGVRAGLIHMVAHEYAKRPGVSDSDILDLMKRITDRIDSFITPPKDKDNKSSLIQKLFNAIDSSKTKTFDRENPVHLGLLLSWLKEGEARTTRLIEILESPVFDSYQKMIHDGDTGYDFRKELSEAFRDAGEDLEHKARFNDLMAQLSFFVKQYDSKANLEKDLRDRMNLVKILKGTGTDSDMFKNQMEFLKGISFSHQTPDKKMHQVNWYQAEEDAFIALQQLKYGRLGVEKVLDDIKEEFKRVYAEGLLNAYVQFLHDRDIEIPDIDQMQEKDHDQLKKIAPAISNYQAVAKLYSSYPVHHEIMDVSAKADFDQYIKRLMEDSELREGGLISIETETDAQGEKQTKEKTFDRKELETQLLPSFAVRYMRGGALHWLERMQKPPYKDGKPLILMEVEKRIGDRKKIWELWEKHWDGIPIDTNQVDSIGNIDPERMTDQDYENLFHYTAVIQKQYANKYLGNVLLSREDKNQFYRNLLFDELIFAYLGDGNLAWDTNLPLRNIVSRVAGNPDAIGLWRTEQFFKNILTDTKNRQEVYQLTSGPKQEGRRLVLWEGERKLGILFDPETEAFFAKLFEGDKTSPSVVRAYSSAFFTMNGVSNKFVELAYGEISRDKISIKEPNQLDRFIRYRLLVRPDETMLSKVEDGILANNGHEEFVMRLNKKNHVKISDRAVAEYAKKIKSGEVTPQGLKALIEDFRIVSKDLERIYGYITNADELLRALEKVKFNKDESGKRDVVRKAIITLAKGVAIRLAEKMPANEQISITFEEEQKEPADLIDLWAKTFLDQEKKKDLVYRITLTKEQKDEILRLRNIGKLTLTEIKTLFSDLRVLQEQIDQLKRKDTSLEIYPKIVFAIAAVISRVSLDHSSLVPEDVLYSKAELKRESKVHGAVVLDAENHVKYEMEKEFAKEEEKKTITIDGKTVVDEKAVVNLREAPIEVGKAKQHNTWILVNSISKWLVIIFLALLLLITGETIRRKRASQVTGEKDEPIGSRLVPQKIRDWFARHPGIPFITPTIGESGAVGAKSPDYENYRPRGFPSKLIFQMIAITGIAGVFAWAI